jgi:hypothetical protein
MKLRAGDWMEVKSPSEILETLDKDGAVAGLPFMPEMLEHCGRRYRVAQLAEKTCVEYPGGVYKFREFRGNDVLILETLRCSGASHDGCQRVCLLFWKAEWVRKVSAGEQETNQSQSNVDELRARLKTMTAPDRYFCQSTALDAATIPLPRRRMLLKCFYEVRSGSRGVFEMIRMIIRPIWRKALKRFPVRVVGKLTRTPVGNLCLQPGELVKIKPESELKQTLDSRGRNRGMFIGVSVGQTNHTEFRVKTRLDRMIMEGTGEMKRMEGTVILEGSICKCGTVFGGCPRRDPVYWREVWLERVGESCSKSEAR